MKIDFIEIGNFRKLLATRIDFSPTKTILVGANNSGKTSAMLALRRFLSQSASSFKIQDLTLSHIESLENIGKKWEDFDLLSGLKEPLHPEKWAKLMPHLDLWLDVKEGEFHHVSSMMPSLAWAGGLIGLRLRLEADDLSTLFHEYRQARKDARELCVAAEARAKKKAKSTGTEYIAPKIPIWPQDLPDFLEKRLGARFKIKAYPLDPKKIVEPSSYLAEPQDLSLTASPLEENPLKHLVRVNFEAAQRGMSDDFDGSNSEDRSSVFPGQKLSSQLSHYHEKHLDPTNNPSPDDLGALEAIEAARSSFDERISEAFQPAFTEVEGMNYPGVTDPHIVVSSEMKASDLLQHKTSVSYSLSDPSEEKVASQRLLRLPEHQNGLGYQNLISMVFKLMRFRDAWMRVGKAEKSEDPVFEPIHLVLLEEPEAHLHVQVQQVFIKKAYDVLRKHDRLGDKEHLTTQLIVSTHSSHVAHETPFSCLRYFRRLPKGLGAEVPISTVVNLRKVFGNTEDETQDFVARYIRAQHADLFFADAAILIEGSAERMLIPHFIKNNFSFLHQCFVTLLEINGSHAHRLKDLIEKLGLLTLIVTDIDAGKKGEGENAKTSSIRPKIGDGQVTMNATLKKWLPKETDFDRLIGKSFSKKEVQVDQLFSVRVAYQTKITKTVSDGKHITLLASTFEDSLALENEEFFKKLDGIGLTKKVKKSFEKLPNWDAVASEIYDALEAKGKASFALDILNGKDFEKIDVPNYINEGLQWLEKKLQNKKSETLILEKKDG